MSLRLSKGWCCSGGLLSGKNVSRSICALSLKLVATLMIGSDACGLGSAFLTVVTWPLLSSYA